eukprot:GHVT01025813.1.p1 GENE.GHVT01025813.1~~GHVT01025813.1.p1  ORF type:complete len:123 (-),score=3.51 GHVT01025813.1:10-378(-)
MQPEFSRLYSSGTPGLVRLDISRSFGSDTNATKGQENDNDNYWQLGPGGIPSCHTIQFEVPDSARRVPPRTSCCPQRGSVSFVCNVVQSRRFAFPTTPAAWRSFLAVKSLSRMGPTTSRSAW